MLGTCLGWGRGEIPTLHPLRQSVVPCRPIHRPACAACRNRAGARGPCFDHPQDAPYLGREGSHRQPQLQQRRHRPAVIIPPTSPKKHHATSVSPGGVSNKNLNEQ